MASLVVTFWAVATMIFIIFRQVGDPLSAYAGQTLGEDQVQAMYSNFGLNEPLYIQYLKYLENIVTLDMGTSFYFGVPASDLVISRLQNTILLTIPALLLAYAFGIILGVYIGWNRGSVRERAGLVFSILFRSSPRFWTGLVFLFILGVKLKLFPIAGILPRGESIGHHYTLLFNPDFYRHIALPILTLAIYAMGLPLLLMRSSVFEVMNEDFIDVIRAKGTSGRRVLINHVARNAILPVATAFGVAVGYSFGGAVLVEIVYSYPGVGRLMVNAIYNGDYPVAQLAFLVMAGAILVMNFVVDIAYGYIDPRVTYD
jgi:peptide/nickel transport system permease protein